MINQPMVNTECFLQVNIMGNDKYIVAYTSDTLLLGDLKTFRISEVRLRLITYFLRD